MDIGLDLNKASLSYGDVAIVNADLTLVDSKAAIQQDILTALSTFLGECFMDNTIGIDFFGQVLVKNPDQGKIDAIFINQILNIPGVQQLIAYSFKQNFQSRQLNISFQVQTTAGIVDYTGTAKV